MADLERFTPSSRNVLLKRLFLIGGGGGVVLHATLTLCGPKGGKKVEISKMSRSAYVN